MALRQVEYDGMLLTAGAFEVAGTGRFIAVLSIARAVSTGTGCDFRLFDPPSQDGMFDDVEDALDTAIAFGRAIVDGSLRGESIADL